MGDGESEKGEESKRIRPVVEELPQENSLSEHGEISSEEAEGKARKVLEELNRTPSNRNEETSSPSVGGKKSMISSKLLIFVIIITAALVAVVSGGVYVYYNSLLEEGEKEVLEEVSTTPSPTVTSSPSPSPSPTPSPEPVDLSEFKLSVQNGSGIIGEASKVEDLLVDAGFGEIVTENAERFDFKSTKVRLKENVPSVVVNAIEDILRKGGYEFEVEDEFLPDDFDFEIVVVVGAS